MSHSHNEHDMINDPHSQAGGGSISNQDKPQEAQDKQQENKNEPPERKELQGIPPEQNETIAKTESSSSPDVRPVERTKGPARPGARGTAAMDPKTRQEVARKGGLAVSRNKQHMAEIGRKGGQSVSKNREHMAQIGRKGGAASRGHR